MMRFITAWTVQSKARPSPGPFAVGSNLHYFVHNKECFWNFAPSHPLACHLHFKHFSFPISVTKLDSAATAALQIRVPQLNPVSLKQPKDTRNIQSISKYRNTLFFALHAAFWDAPVLWFPCTFLQFLLFFGALIQIFCSSFTQTQ